jgi:hypothetical protein
VSDGAEGNASAGGRGAYVTPRRRCTVCGAAVGRAIGRRTRRRVCATCLELERVPCARCGLDAQTAEPGEPLCAHCKSGRNAPCRICGQLTIVRDRAGEPRCEFCYQRPRRPCGRCGRLRAIVRLATDGEPDLCAVCWKGSVIACERCGRVRPCRGERTGRMLCQSCRPSAPRTCARCGRAARAFAHWPEGPVCGVCYAAALRAKDTCPGCGTTARLLRYPGFPEPVCRRCAGAPADHVCSECGAEDHLYERGRCARCTLAARLEALLGDRDARERRGLQGVFVALHEAPKPRAVLRWLQGNRPAVQALARIAAGELALSHEALDALAPSRSLLFLSDLLVAAGALPPRDPALARLERWIAEHLDTIQDADQRHLVRTYARWVVLRRYRTASRRAQLNEGALNRAKDELKAATALLAWLAGRGVQPAGCRQSDIDAWLADGPPRAHVARPFVRWAIRRGAMPEVDLPARDRDLVGLQIDLNARTKTARRLLHAPDIPSADRVAGALVVIYAQPLSRITRLTVDDVDLAEDSVALRFGESPLQLDAPLADHLRTLLGARRSPAAAALESGERWLFPGAAPGRPIGELALGRRLKRLGIDCAAHRRTALLELSRQVPAPLLAALLGIHVNTAAKWGQLAGHNQVDYLALRDPDP